MQSASSMLNASWSMFNAIIIYVYCSMQSSSILNANLVLNKHSWKIFVCHHSSRKLLFLYFGKVQWFILQILLLLGWKLGVTDLWNLILFFLFRVPPFCWYHFSDQIIRVRAPFHKDQKRYKEIGKPITGQAELCALSTSEMPADSYQSSHTYSDTESVLLTNSWRKQQNGFP